MGELDWDADDTVLGVAWRELAASGVDPERIVVLVEKDLRERGLRRHVMCEWKREATGKRGCKGPLVLDAAGLPQLVGFTAMVPVRPKDLVGKDGKQKRAYGSKQGKAWGGERLRGIARANYVLGQMEEERGVIGGDSLNTGSPSVAAPSSELAAHAHPVEVASVGPVQLTVAGAELRRGVTPVFSLEELTFVALVERYRKVAPLNRTSVSYLQRLDYLMRRVLPGETVYPAIDGHGWENVRAEVRALKKERSDLAGPAGVQLRAGSAEGIWDALLAVLDFAVREGSLSANLARTIRRRRGGRNRRVPVGRMRPLTLGEIRDVELTARAISLAAHQVVREGAAAKTRFGKWLPMISSFVPTPVTATLTAGRSVSFEIGVAAIGEVPVVTVGEGKHVYFAGGLEAMVALLYGCAPREGELGGLHADSVDLESDRVIWEWKRNDVTGRAQFKDREISPLTYGLKTSRDGDPATRNQGFRGEVADALGRWIQERNALREMGWRMKGWSAETLFPSIYRCVVKANVCRRLVYAVQNCAGVHESWLHRARHSLHAVHALTGIPVADSAAQLGQTVEAAVAAYMLATNEGIAMAVQAGTMVRELIDSGMPQRAAAALVRQRLAEAVLSEGAPTMRLLEGGLAS